MYAVKRKIINNFRKNNREPEVNRNTLLHVENIVFLIYKILRSFKLYSKDNPIFEKYTEELLQSINSFHSHSPLLQLKIKENGLVFGSEHYYTKEEKEKNGIKALFDDNIKELYFTKEISHTELFDFIKIVNESADSAAGDYDISSKFWDRNFNTIFITTEEDFSNSYIFRAKNFIGNEKQSEPETVFELLYHNEVDYFSELAFKTEPLKQNEIEKFLKLSSKKESSIHSYTNEMMKQILKKESSSEKVELINRSIKMWKNLISEGNIKDGLFFLHSIISACNKLQDNKLIVFGALKKQLTILTDDDFIDEIFSRASTLDSSEHKYFAELTTILPPNKFPVLVKNITALPSKEFRLTCLSKLRGKKRNIEYVRPALFNDDWRVVRNTINIIKKGNSSIFIPHLKKIMNHSEEQIKKEIVELLADDVSEESLTLLEQSLFSSNRKIRLSALNSIVKTGSSKTRSILGRILSKKNLASITSSEVEDYFRVILSSPSTENFDLVGNFLLSENSKLKKIALGQIAIQKNLSPFARQLRKMIEKPDFEKMKIDDLRQFMNLIRPENFQVTLPALEKVFTLKGGVFNKNIYHEYKKTVISSVSRFGERKDVLSWMRKAESKGNRETVEIIKNIKSVQFKHRGE